MNGSSYPPKPRSDAPAGTPRTKGRDDASALRLYTAMDNLRKTLAGTRDAHALLRLTTRAVSRYFNAPSAVIGRDPGGQQPIVLACDAGREADWDAAALHPLMTDESRPGPAATAYTRIERRERPWALLCLRATSGDFSWGDRDSLRRLGSIASELLADIDHEQVVTCRSRIDRRVIGSARPTDVYYHILDGLKSLVEYDHSAQFLEAEQGRREIEIKAEKIAWARRKSGRISERIGLDSVIVPCTEANVFRYRCMGGDDDVWKCLDAASPGWLDELVSRPLPADPDSAEPEEAEALVAVFPLGERCAVLRVSSRAINIFGSYEQRIVESMCSFMQIAIENAERSERLQLHSLGMERQSAMSELARAVAHDINNALAGSLPLVQQIRSEIAAGEAKWDVVAEDLRQIEQSIELSRTIFENMLSFARRAADSRPIAEVRPAIANALALLNSSLKRHKVRIELDVPEREAILVAVPPADLERLFLNIIQNARDSMRGKPGILSIRCIAGPTEADISVRDTGIGMTPEQQAQVFRPFFTTKPEGRGLGLTICRSIVVDAHGKMSIESSSGEGTMVRIVLPRAVARDDTQRGEP